MSDNAQPSQDGFALFPDRSVVAMRVNGELKDLATTVADSDAVEPVTIDSPDGLGILRHSAAHVLAQAVQRINPQANLGIGPPITDGFYYDFGVEEPFTPEDVKAIDKEMQRIIREGPAVRAPRRDRRRGPRRAGRRAVQARAHRARRAALDGFGDRRSRRARTSRSAPASSPSTTT